MNATEREIRTAHLILVKVWHPDRFQGDKELKEAAEAKLKDINAATMFLSLPSSREWRRQQLEPSSPDTASVGPFQRAQSTAERSETDWTAPIVSPGWSFSWPNFPTLRNYLRAATVASAILLGIYICIGLDVHSITSDSVARVYGDCKDAVLKSIETPKRRLLEAVQDLGR